MRQQKSSWDNFKLKRILHNYISVDLACEMWTLIFSDLLEMRICSSWSSPVFVVETLTLSKIFVEVNISS